MSRSIAPIATLPVFFKLGGRRAVVAGGGEPAVWKAELLSAAGADVLVLAAEPCDAMAALADGLPDRLRLERRDWSRPDLDGAALAIGALSDTAAGAAFRDAARAAGVPVNVVDAPALCDFQFGTIVERSPLLIGISTDGAAPVLGQALRARIEALLPAAMGAWAEAARDWRAPLQALRLGFAARRRFWERFSELALDEDREPCEADRLACEAAALETARASTGRLFLVGSGPGEADLVTLRAVKALQSADLILYEPETPAAVLVLGRREADRQDVGPTAMLTAADAVGHGSTVVWVGPGDPETCPAWTPIRQAACASALEPRLIGGLRCPACPRGCAAR